ncbi:MAG: flagellar protein FliS, partial [Stellaceae bacterium]
GTRRSEEFGAYRAAAALDADPEDFMMMALDSLRALLTRAEAAINTGDKVEKARALDAAGKLVEFLLGLSGIEHGDLSDRLAAIYQFVMTSILRGNALDDTEAVAAARQAVEHITGVWRGIFAAKVIDPQGATP